MSPQHPAPGANTAAAAAPRAPEAGPPAAPSAPAGETPGPAAAPGAKEPATPPDGKTAAPPASSAAAKPAEAPGSPAEAIGVAAAVTTKRDAGTGAGVDGGRPRTPVLAGAAFVGAALIAIPLLLIGSANDEGHRDTAKGTVAEGADTVLDPDPAPADLDDYEAAKPSSSPSGERPKETGPPKAAAPEPAPPKPVPPTPEPRTSSPPGKKPAPEPPPGPRPEAAPEPDWSTASVGAPSVLRVNQAWTNNRIRMVMQPDGNLVVLNELSKPIWASMTFGEDHRAIFQPDGNLVIHNGADRPIWASRTHDHGGAHLVLRADAKVVIVHNGRVVWST